MKAIAVTPGRPDSLHLRDVPTPSLTDLPDGRGVLVKTLRVGVDGTDKEINAAEYGAPPAGDDYLIIGHESFGVVEAVGANVTEFQPGDYVVASVRRPGSSLYDQVGLQDMTTDDTYFERGINLRHGYLSEYFVEDMEYLIQIPERLKTVAGAHGADQRGAEGHQPGLRNTTPASCVAAPARGRVGRRYARAAGSAVPSPTRDRGGGDGPHETAVLERGLARGDRRTVRQHEGRVVDPGLRTIWSVGFHLRGHRVFTAGL